MTARATRARPGNEMLARQSRMVMWLQKNPDLERWQLCELLGIDIRTCNRWLNEIHQRPGDLSLYILKWLRRVGRKNLGQGFSSPF